MSACCCVYNDDDDDNSEKRICFVFVWFNCIKVS